MAPGPSTGWKLVWRALKAGRHKAARTLKVADRADELEQNPEENAAVFKSNHWDKFSNRPARIKSKESLALSFVPLDGGHKSSGVALSLRFPITLPLLGHQSHNKYGFGHVKSQAWQLHSTLSTKSYSQSYSKAFSFTLTPEVLLKLTGISISSHYDTTTNVCLTSSQLDKSSLNLDGDVGGLTERYHSISTCTTPNSSSCNLQLLSCAEIDTEMLQSLSPTSSISSTTSSLMFDAPDEATESDDISFDNVVTGMERRFLKEEAGTTVIPPELKPKGRTLLQPDVKSFWHNIDV